MLHLVTVHFKGQDALAFKVVADTGTGALIKVLAFDWTIEQRKVFLGARVDPWTKDTTI